MKSYKNLFPSAITVFAILVKPSRSSFFSFFSFKLTSGRHNIFREKLIAVGPARIDRSASTKKKLKTLVVCTINYQTPCTSAAHSCTWAYILLYSHLPMRTSPCITNGAAWISIPPSSFLRSQEIVACASRLAYNTGGLGRPRAALLRRINLSSGYPYTRSARNLGHNTRRRRLLS